MITNSVHAVVMSICIPQGWSEECVIFHLYHPTTKKRLGWLELPVTECADLLDFDPASKQSLDRQGNHLVGQKITLSINSPLRSGRGLTR